MRKQILKLINTEIINAKQGKEAFMILKVNNLVDFEVINKLYEASNAGVKVKLIVRSMCSIVSGVAGLSENIEAISIVGKYLEHSRIFIFCNGGQKKYFISSADLMSRNLDARAEVVCPIYDKTIQKDIETFMDFQWRDNVKARILNEHQANEYKTEPKGVKINSQEAIYEYWKAKSITNYELRITGDNLK